MQPTSTASGSAHCRVSLAESAGIAVGLVIVLDLLEFGSGPGSRRAGIGGPGADGRAHPLPEVFAELGGGARGVAGGGQE